MHALNTNGILLSRYHTLDTLWANGATSDAPAETDGFGPFDQHLAQELGIRPSDLYIRGKVRERFFELKKDFVLQLLDQSSAAAAEYQGIVDEIDAYNKLIVAFATLTGHTQNLEPLFGQLQTAPKIQKCLSDYGKQTNWQTLPVSWILATNSDNLPNILRTCLQSQRQPPAFIQQVQKQHRSLSDFAAFLEQKQSLEQVMGSSFTLTQSKPDSTSTETKDKKIEKLESHIQGLEAEVRMMREQNAQVLQLLQRLTGSSPPPPLKIEPIAMPRLVLGGLPRLENTCYMNAAIQALLASPQFTASLSLAENAAPLVRTLRMIANTKENPSESGRLYSSLNELQTLLVTDRSQPDLYNAQGRMQDSATVFEAILEVTPHRPIMRTTYSAGPEVQTSVVTETLGTIDVPIYSGQTLQQIVDSEFSPKAQNTPRDPWTATLREGGSRQLANYTITRQLVHSAPNILVLQFPRRTFRNSQTSYDAQSIPCPLDVPLDMTCAFGGNNTRYRLVSCVNHHHPQQHYTAYVFREAKWFHCDDINVSEVARPPAENASFLVFEKVLE